jgi:alcohol dehydrogenase class IV
MLPAAMRVNRDVRRGEFARLAAVMTGRWDWTSDSAAAEAAVARITDLCAELGVPTRLSAIGASAEQLPALVAGSRGSSMSGNPRELTDGELRELLEAML